MPRSERAIRASRANGARSRGPKTAAGKLRSSRNAITHGFNSTYTVIPGESQEDFDSFSDGYHRALQPATAAERFLVAGIATASWKLRRARSIEDSMLDSALAQLNAHDPGQARGALSPIELLYRYQTPLHRRASDAFRTLLSLRQAQSRTFERTNPELPADQPGPGAVLPDLMPAAAPAEKTFFVKTNLELEHFQYLLCPPAGVKIG